MNQIDELEINAFAHHIVNQNFDVIWHNLTLTMPDIFKVMGKNKTRELCVMISAYLATYCVKHQLPPEKMQDLEISLPLVLVDGNLAVKRGGVCIHPISNPNGAGSITLIFMGCEQALSFITHSHQELYFHTFLLGGDKVRNEYCVYSHRLCTLREDKQTDFKKIMQQENFKTLIERADTLEGGEDPFFLNRRYIGITKRGILKRYKEHYYSAIGGRKKYRFQEALAQLHLHQEAGTIRTFLVSKLIAFNLTFDEAMQVEEDLVFAYSLWPAGLNMIPGGFAGLAYLHKYQSKIEPKHFAENRAHYIDKLTHANPLLSAHWNDADFVAKVICGWGNRLSIELVRQIASYQEFGFSWEQVLAQVGQSHPQLHQIKKVFEGKTYQRAI